MKKELKENPSGKKASGKTSSAENPFRDTPFSDNPSGDHRLKDNIFLIGFMGTGKSTIADCLHTLYGMDVVEMDSGRGGTLQGFLSGTPKGTALLARRLGFGPPFQTGRFASSWCLFD